MVYCTECGAQNPDDAEFCIKCGAELHPGRDYQRNRRWREREMCLGVPVSGQIWGLIFGVIIILWGLSQLMGMRLDFFALVAIVLGLIILTSALRGRASHR